MIVKDPDFPGAEIMICLWVPDAHGHTTMIDSKSGAIACQQCAYMDAIQRRDQNKCARERVCVREVRMCERVCMCERVRGRQAGRQE